MVTLYGFSDKLGPINYEHKLKNDVNSYQIEPSADKTLELIDNEIKIIIEEQKNKAKKILDAKKKDLKILAEGLLKYETLDREEVEKLLKGELVIVNKEKVDFTKTNFSIFNPFLNDEIKKSENKENPKDKRKEKTKDDSIFKKEKKKNISTKAIVKKDTKKS
jgi:hypothetical protein